jgi:PAS domain S-box-containing protein
MRDFSNKTRKTGKNRIGIEHEQMSRTADPEALVRSNSSLRAIGFFFLTENSSSLIAYIDAEERYCRVNKAYEQFFQTSTENILGRKIREIAGPEHYAIAEPNIRRVLAGEHPAFPSCIHHADGSLRNIEVSYMPQRAETGKIAGFISLIQPLINRDRLDEARARLAAIIDFSGDAIISKTLDGVITSWNDAAEKIFGFSEAEAVGEHITLIIPPEKFAEEEDVIARLRQGEKIEHFETERRTKDGRTVFISLSVSPIRNALGQIIGGVKVARDITDRRRFQLRDAFLLRLDEEMRVLSDPFEIVQYASRLLVEHLAADRCSYAEIDSDKGEVDVIGNYALRLPSIVGRYEMASFGSEFHRRMTAGSPYIVRNSSEEIGADGKASYEAIGIAAVIAIPLVKDGKLVAGLGLHQATPRDWRADEIELVRVVASRCWESIQRARAERELRESEERFRTLANTIPNLAWMADPNGYIFWYNRRWYDYTGVTPKEMQGWGWQSVHDPKLLPLVLERWHASIATGEPFEMVFPLRGADGGFRSFLTRVEPIKDESGRVVRWFGSNTDITSQEEAKRREKRVRETAELLNRVGQTLASELDPQKLTQKITDLATAAVQAQFGAFFHSVTDERGESYVLYTLSGVPREAFSQFPMPRNTKVFGPTFRGEGVVRSDDITKDPRYGKNPPYNGIPAGHLPVCSFLTAPVISRDGSVMGGLFFGHEDVGVFTAEAEEIVRGIAAQAAIALDNASLYDQSNRSAATLRATNEQLRRLNDDLNQFAYSASHDLREPLRMVAIYSQLLARKVAGTLDGEGEEFLEHILKGALRMEALVRDLLAFTQAADASDDVCEITDANNALRVALDNLATVIDETGAKIESSDLPRVKIQSVRLAQLLQNLIGNAVKYRRDAPVAIALSAAREGDLWKFSVADNGIGIEEQYREQIFGVFKRLHTSDEYPGTGIGLAICQRIVQRAGGRIWVESEPGRGSTFHFTIPGDE